MSAQSSEEDWIRLPLDRLELNGPFQENMKAAVSPFFEISPLTPEFRAQFRLDRNHLKGLDTSLSQVNSVPQVWQSIKRIDVGTTAGFSVFILREGIAIGEFGGHPRELKAGDVLLIDHAQPLRLALGAHSATLLYAARHLWPDTMLGRSLHGLLLPADYALTRLATSQLDATFRYGPLLTQSVFASAMSAMTDLFAYASKAWSEAREAGVLGGRHTLRDRALSFVDANIENPRLGPEMLAKGIGTSRAALYRVLKLEGGVAALIQARRLDHAIRLLRATSLPRLSIGSIAYRLCFKSEAHFSRAFKAKYGVTPSEARIRRPTESGAPNSEMDVLRRQVQLYDEADKGQPTVASGPATAYSIG